MGRKSIKILTKQEFEDCRPYLTHYASERVEIAYQAMVLEISQAVLASKYKKSKQSINSSVAKVWEAHEIAQSAKSKDNAVIMPFGWEQSTFIAPAEIINKLKENFQSYMATYESLNDR